MAWADIKDKSGRTVGSVQYDSAADVAERAARAREREIDRKLELYSQYLDDLNEVIAIKELPKKEQERYSELYENKSKIEKEIEKITSPHEKAISIFKTILKISLILLAISFSGMIIINYAPVDIYCLVLTIVSFLSSILSSVICFVNKRDALTKTANHRNQLHELSQEIISIENKAYAKYNEAHPEKGISHKRIEVHKRTEASLKETTSPYKKIPFKTIAKISLIVYVISFLGMMMIDYVPIDVCCLVLAIVSFLSFVFSLVICFVNKIIGLTKGEKK